MRTLRVFTPATQAVLYVRFIVRTDYYAKPIPQRDFDWTAIDDSTYDGAPESNCPVGCGRTEREAIDDLCEKLNIETYMVEGLEP